MNCSSTRRKRRLRLITAGMTLVELLVVIVIVFVLASIFMPHGGHGREDARRVSCMSNMKQIALAFAQYRADFDDTYPAFDKTLTRIEGKPPLPRSPETNGLPNHDWHTVLHPYTKYRDLFRCPSDRTIERSESETAGVPSKPVDSCSYTVNGWSEYHLRQVDIARPANWVLLAERNNPTSPNAPRTRFIFHWWLWQGAGALVWPPSMSPDPLPNAANDLALTRHEWKAKKSANWLYGDGHVKSGNFSAHWKSDADNAFWPDAPR